MSQLRGLKLPTMSIGLQYMHNPLEAHWDVVKRIGFGLHVKGQSKLNLMGFCDPDWASD